MGKTRGEARKEASQDIHKLNFDGVLSIHEKNTLREMYKKSSDGIDGDSKYMRAWLVELKYVRGWIDNLVADKDIQQRIAQNSIDEHIAQIVEKMNTYISNNRAGSEHIGILQLYLKWNLGTTVPKTRSLMGENRIDGKLWPLTAKAVIAYVTGRYGERESGEVFSKKILEQSRQSANYEVTNVSLEGIPQRELSMMMNTMWQVGIAPSTSNLAAMCAVWWMEWGYEVDTHKEGYDLRELIDKASDKIKDMKTILGKFWDAYFDKKLAELEKLWSKSRVSEFDLFVWSKSIVDDIAQNIVITVDGETKWLKDALAEDINGSAVVDGLMRYKNVVQYPGETNLDVLVRNLSSKPYSFGKYQVSPDVLLTRILKKGGRGVAEQAFLAKKPYDKEGFVRALHRKPPYTITPEQAEYLCQKYFFADQIAMYDFDGDGSVDSDKIQYFAIDHNAWSFCCRNTAFQIALSQLTGIKLTLDGDLTTYDREGNPIYNPDGQTMKALREYLTKNHRTAIDYWCKKIALESKSLNLRDNALYKKIMEWRPLFAIPTLKSSGEERRARGYANRATREYHRIAANARVRNKEQKEQDPSRRTITVDQAVAMTTRDLKEREKKIVWVIDQSKTPEYSYPLAKQRIFVHGSAGSDAWLIRTWSQSGDFAYGITRNGLKCQFFDDSLWAGAIGKYGMIEGDEQSLQSWIAIEFSGKEIFGPEGLKESEPPTPEQIRAGQELIADIRWRQPQIRWVYTSFQAVSGYTGAPLNQEVHTDTHSRPKSTLQALWVDLRAKREMPTVPVMDTRFLT